MADSGLTPLQARILADLLRHGDNVPGNIGENVGSHPNSVSRAMRDLDRDGLVRTKGRGVWQITEKGQQALREQGPDG